MVDILSAHVAFLLFESIFCFISAILCALKNSQEKKARVVITLLNIMAGALLLFDFFEYIFHGRPGALASFVMYSSNLMVFLLCDLFLIVICIYLSIVIFGEFSFKKDQPCRKRNILCFLISIIGMLLVLISHFTGLYYTIDGMNQYHRGDYFYVSVIIAMLGMAIIFSILIQYRKKIKKYRFLALLSYILLPLIGFIFQLLFFGFTYMDIGIALSVNILFVENIVYQNKRIIMAERTDIRTGLANEQGCMEWLEEHKGHPELAEHAVVFFDISRISSINRKYGPETGNRVLKAFAGSFKEEFSKEEFIGHLHGDQFVAIIRKEHLPEVMKKLSDLKVKFTDDTGRDRESRLPVTAGVYEIKPGDFNAEDILTYAATALEQAKAGTGHPIVYMTKELMDSIEEKKRLEAKIRKGLENGEFEPYYQPKVNSRTKLLCGAEALARWNHKGEIINPNDFIHIMEMNESICDLDMYMLRAICKDISSWKEQGLQIPPISINFSRRNLADPDLAKKIDEIVTESGVPKELIEIEITETTDEFSISVMKEFVDDLRRRGFCSSIDDFGSGNASMAVLREISFDTMKIDKGFIDRDFSKDLTILNHIIKMAQSIGLTIVAEGVEQENQVKTLNSFGAEIIQGFYYDRPMPKDQMIERIKNPRYDK
ncbi:MAG: EAL domain-containing protein [Clostridiales bacterium]|nr:EAL domain-containing protein [Clostridiales bacterium]